MRLDSTTFTTSGITSPARWTTTVSPTWTPFFRISSSLWSVAWVTVTPPTWTGFMTATGVRTPVRPIPTMMSSMTVVACVGANLTATAQRGLRETVPSRSWRVRELTLRTIPSIS
ncbi:MAG: hypothetical protein A4E67_02311 [Syntrophaceae bacterium PtaB.Bin038]|nr:MAG: hypothetical protein A4E67_02311 [Syntrophaceae bacterium PtaB.Bin038]